MEDAKTVVQQHVDVQPSDESSAAQSTWVKPSVKRLALKEALASRSGSSNDFGGAPDNRS